MLKDPNEGISLYTAVAQSVDQIGGGGGGGTMTQDESNAEDDAINESADYNTEMDSTLDQSTAYDPNVEAFWGSAGVSDFNSLSNVIGIFGLPYQFMPHVDPRNNSDELTDLGSVYAEKIISNIPLLFICPGKPSFMKTYSKGEARNVLATAISGFIGGDGDSAINGLVSKNGKFYTFEYTIDEYFQYVNPMCRICANLMQLTEEGDGPDNTPWDSVNWRDYTQKAATSIVEFASDYMAIPFYIDTDTQISETMTNDVTETSLASTVDSFSDMGRELMFYLGYTPHLAGFENNILDTLSNQEVLMETVNGMISDDNIFKTLATQLTSVVTGGRLVFPKIWSDSSFSRSYDVNIKLRSPDMDPASLFMNIIAPLCHILGFVQPKMIKQNPNGYMSPFLVRCCYKGFFNIDMGIITNASITKGDDAQWSPNGVPTSVDISLTITDLYETMSMTASKGILGAFDTMDNTAQMDYLMTMCGINIYKPEISRMIDLYAMSAGNAVTDIPSRLWSSLRSSVSSSIINFYRGGR